MAYSKAKLKSTGDLKKTWFQTIPNRKRVKQMLAYSDNVTDFTQTHVHEPTSFMGIPNPVRPPSLLNHKFSWSL